MSKTLIFLAIFVFFMSLNVDLVSAQTATASSTSTSSATATNSATTTTTTSTTTTSTSSATTLPQSGAHDVLILFSAGVIFLIAGVTALSGTKQVFAELEEQTDIQ